MGILATITTPFRSSIGLVVLACFLVLVTACGSVFGRLWEAETEALKREAVTVQNTFNAHKQQRLSEIERYAASNAAYQNIDQSFSQAWVETRFGEELARDSNYNGTFLMAPNGEIVFENIPQEESWSAADVQRLMSKKRTFADIRDNFFVAAQSLPETGSFSGHFPALSNIEVVTFGEEVALAASFAIVPDPGGIALTAQAPHILVAVYCIDADYLSHVLRDLPVSDLEFIRTEPTDQNSVPLYSDEDTVAGYLVWQPMSQSMEILVASTPFLIVCFCVIFAIAVYSLHQNARGRVALKRRERLVEDKQRELEHGKRALEQAHEDLQSNQEELYRLSLVAKHASDSIILSNAKSEILWVNDGFSRMTGYRADEAIGATPGELLNGPDTDFGTVAKIRDHIKRGEEYYTEVLSYTKSGAPFWVEVNVVPVLDDTGAVEFIVGVERDITHTKAHARELADAKRAAEQADRAKSEFLANMSHEIRTPMNGIMGMADLLAESELGAEEQAYVDVVRSSSNALLKIINDILDLSRLETGAVEIAGADFDPRSCVEASVDLLRPKAKEKGISLTVTYAEDLPRWAHGDDGRLRQILVNLVGNAVKFTSEGAVTVRASAADGDPYLLSIAVEDTGIGISEEHASHVFDRFSQADTATTRAYGGTGLGLTISKALAERMGGDITLRSELGNGCCFTVQLPLAPAQEPSLSLVTKEHSRATTQLSPCVVLLAEDNKVNRLLIRKYLSDQPLELVEAEDGRKAVDLCRDVQPDIVLMDMSMPELDGVSATREIRALGIGQPTIVALTANAFESDRKACLSAGMDHFLSKPIDKNSLLQTLAALQVERMGV